MIELYEPSLFYLQKRLVLRLAIKTDLKQKLNKNEIQKTETDKVYITLNTHYTKYNVCVHDTEIQDIK